MPKRGQRNEKRGKGRKMKEQEQKLSPTDQMLNFLEGASKNQLQWELMKKNLEDEVWQDNLIRSGVDLDMMNERIREIDFEKRHET